MNNFFKITVSIGVVLIFVLSVLIFLKFSKPSSNQVKTNLAPTVTHTVTTVELKPTGIDQYPPKYVETQREIDEAHKEFADKEARSGKLLNKMPYKGKNFTLDYDYKEGTFIAVINAKDYVAGQMEFTEFLKDNNIADQTEITNLLIKQAELP